MPLIFSHSVAQMTWKILYFDCRIKLYARELKNQFFWLLFEPQTKPNENESEFSPDQMKPNQTNLTQQTNERTNDKRTKIVV